MSFKSMLYLEVLASNKILGQALFPKIFHHRILKSVPIKMIMIMDKFLY